MFYRKNKFYKRLYLQSAFVEKLKIKALYRNIKVNIKRRYNTFSINDKLKAQLDGAYILIDEYQFDNAEDAAIYVLEELQQEES